MATKLQFYAVLFIAAAASSFTIINAEAATPKSEEHVDKENSASEVTSSQEDSKEKRSQEEIMFGNQQNKPNGLVDDLMGMSENVDEGEGNSASALGEKSNDSQQKAVSPLDEPAKDESQIQNQEDSQNAMMMGGANQDDPWYKAMPVSSSAMHYLANAQAMKNLPTDAYSNGLYDQEDLYRRKRQLLGHPMPLHKRSLRSSLGQMIQKRGVRMPRRSMRLKRSVDMEDLLNLIGNERYFNEEEQMKPHIFSGRAQTVVGKRHVPGRYSGYPETPAPEYRYPYVFQHRGDGILSSENDLEENSDALEGENMDDIDNLMLLPPNSRYADAGLPAYGSRDELQDEIQKWLSRHTVPSAYRVQRRSAPFFYPVDYRYMPGYKKRSTFRANRPSGRFSGDEESESDFGKWGHVVQVPEAYANPEDIARLYGLANLMAADGEDTETRVRRSA